MLERVLSSQTFKRSERARALLAYLVEREQAGEAERLKGYTIGVDVFGKNQEFDSSADALVRVQAGRLRDLLAQYYQAEGRADPLRIVIPLGGYVPTYEVVAPSKPISPAPLTLAERAVRLARTAAPFSAAPALATGMRSRGPLGMKGVVGIGEVRLLWAALALVTAMLVVVAYRMASIEPGVGGGEVAVVSDVQQPAGSLEPPGIETLPTVRIVTVGDSPPVSRVSAAFRTALAGFETINLIGGEYWGPDHRLPADAAGFVLSISPTILEGGVLLELQSLGSGKVLINRRLSAHDLAPERLEGRVAELVNAIAPVNGAIYGYLKQSGPQSALVNCLLLSNAYYFEWTEQRHFVAYRCFEKLVEERATSPMVYASLASLRVSAKVDGYAYPSRLDDAETLEMLRRAVRAAPTNPYVYYVMGYFHSQIGNKSEAIEWMRKGYELNSLDVYGAAAYGYALVFSGNYREGATVLRRAVDASPLHPSWWDYCLFLAHFMMGETDEAFETTNAFSTLNKWQYVAARLIAAHGLGDEQRADELLAQLITSHPKVAADPKAAFREDHYPPELAAKLVDALRAAGVGGAG